MFLCAPPCLFVSPLSAPSWIRTLHVVPDARGGPAEAARDWNAAPATSGPHPVILGLASAVLLWSAFPPAGWSWLAWLALAPLFLLIVSRRSRASLYFGAWVGGMAFWLLSIHWIRLTDETAWLAWVVMALVLSAWWPGFLALARLAVLRLRLPMMIAAPVLWVGLEYVRAFLLTGFPWYYLAHSQHHVLPLIQIADFAGALGLSFLIALVNAWWVDLLTLPLFRPTDQGPWPTRPQVVRLVVLVVLLVGTVGYRRLPARLGAVPPRPEARLAPVEPHPALQDGGRAGRTHRNLPASDRPCPARPRAPRPDRLARDVLSLRLRGDRPEPRPRGVRTPGQAARREENDQRLARLAGRRRAVICTPGPTRSGCRCWSGC